MSHTEDMKELIRRELQSIGSLDERIAFKGLMEQVFLSLYETNEQMYDQLEKRVEDELAFDVNRYLIKTGVIEREYFDASHHLMSPMEDMDLVVKAYTIEDIADSMEQNGEFVLMKVMLRCDYKQAQDIWDEAMEFSGEIETGQPAQTWNITAKLRQNTDYIKKIGHLYQIFIKNGILWQTVNAPYLYKMADVVLTAIPDGMKGNETIKKVQVHFDKYSQIVCHGVIPIWNIQKITLDGVGFPVPCEDHKNYEHRISIKEHGTKYAYLAEDDSDIRSISQREDRLLIISDTNAARKWDIFMIKNSEDSQIDHYTNPIMQNQKAETFAEKFQRKWNQSVKTRVELARFIKGFGLEQYVVYEDCEVLDQFKSKPETYSMNPFIEDEIRDVRAQKKLLLYFKSGRDEPWLQRDIASFLVTEVQRIYPEYECGGIVL